FSLAVSGDLVVVSQDARFEYAYPRIGLTGDGGSTYFLPRLVGLRRAKEIALLDEPIDPTEAVDLGLATEAVPSDEFEERLDELSSDLATGPTKAYGAIKKLLSSSFDNALSEQMAAETDAIARMTYTQDFEKGYSAFFTDEDPDFEGK
ncbi:MAG: enoyl-CoA hydratase-related protein, partial [Halobacteria archaeon]|nr:enoyl-CoA hydratase-related protein [Halobacteria archaeon]